jgi:DNA-binding GntR family transcriptional regulator
MTVDGKAIVPKYYQVEQTLRRRLAGLAVGSALSAEPQLSKEFGVSRTTLRMALDALVSEGLLSRVQGRGTFVRAKSIEYPLAYHPRSGVPAPDELTTHRVLRAETRPAGEEFARIFGIPASAAVTRVERLALEQGIPMGIGVLVVPSPIAPRLRRADFSTGRFFYTLADHGVVIVRHRVVIESLIIDADMARSLGIRAGLPGIGLTRFGLGRRDKIVAYVRIVTRGDIGRYVLEFDHGAAAALTAP